MCPSRSPLIPLAALLCVAACADEPATAVSLAGLGIPSDLEFVLPYVAPERLVLHDTPEASAASGPARSEGFAGEVEDPEQPPAWEGTFDYSDATAAIWGAKTTATFSPGQGVAWGEHYYYGNKGRIETTATLIYQDQPLASQTGVTEQDHFFLFPWEAHYILNVTRINTDSECGLGLDARSRHLAWWEVAPGAPAIKFSTSELSSGADRARQPDCASVPTSGGGGGGGGGGQVTCYIWIEYDIYTSEIYDVQLLYCEDGG